MDSEKDIRERYRKTIVAWDKVADLYQDKFMEMDLYNSTYDVFLDMLPKRASVLDAACGPGVVSKYLMDENPELSVLGIDVSEAMIDRAKINVPKGEFQICDLRSVSQLDLTFDGIVCGFGIPYLQHEDCVSFIEAISKKLNFGGVLYLSFVAGEYDQSSYVKGRSGDDMFFYYHSQDSIKNILFSNNFQLEKEEEVLYDKERGDWHTVYVAVKGR